MDLSERIPRNDIIVYQQVSDNLGIIEEVLRNISIKPDNPKLRPGPNCVSKDPEISLQIYVGQPGQGQVMIVNPTHTENWLEALAEKQKEKTGKDDFELVNFDFLKEIAEVTIEDNVHTVNIDYNPHLPEASGICRHKHKIWYPKQLPLRIETCECLLNEYAAKRQAESD